MFQIIIGLAITYGICYALDKIGEYCDFKLPQIQEKRYKKKVLEKFGLSQPEDLLGLERKNLETLERLAKSFADKVTITSENMPIEMQKQVWNTNYNYYFNKYKNIYS